MKKKSQINLQELRLITLKKEKLQHIKGGSDIGTQDVVDT